MRPWSGARNPLIRANSVVLPAPFGPITAVMRPASAASETPSTASRPPKRLARLSVRSSGSAMGALRRRDGRRTRKARENIGQDASDAARRERDDEDQHAAVHDEVEAGRVAGE